MWRNEEARVIVADYDSLNELDYGFVETVRTTLIRLFLTEAELDGMGSLTSGVIDLVCASATVTTNALKKFQPAYVFISDLVTPGRMIDKNFMKEMARGKVAKIVAPPGLDDIKVMVLPCLLFELPNDDFSTYTKRLLELSSKLYHRRRIIIMVNMELDLKNASPVLKFMKDLNQPYPVFMQQMEEKYKSMSEESEQVVDHL
ncbi:hypothetical protein OESDEN_07791 [Oesophagostomum dentatum]|uniref:Uncharacterized protein n=1 Tax=Oesophagostomum dentatum TaxID=61180 RepID=A0A0B1T932_OESDE|nr:hypothetical protein OESDEN_07791 [Oesophagostomum dentatum]